MRLVVTTYRIVEIGNPFRVNEFGKMFACSEEIYCA